jgi:hypothetical protein
VTRHRPPSVPIQRFCEQCGRITGQDNIVDEVDYDQGGRIGQVVEHGRARREDKTYAVVSKRQLQRRAEQLGSRLGLLREQALAAVKLAEGVFETDRGAGLKTRRARRGLYTLVSCLRLVLVGAHRPVTISHLARACDVPAGALAAEYYRVKRLLAPAHRMDPKQDRAYLAPAVDKLFAAAVPARIGIGTRAPSMETPSM